MGEEALGKLVRRVEARSTVLCSVGKGCWVSQGNSSTGTQATPPHVHAVAALATGLSL